MIYVKSFLAGLAAFVILAALIIGAVFFLAPAVIGFVAFQIWSVVTVLLLISGVVSYWVFKNARRSQSGFTRSNRFI